MSVGCGTLGGPSGFRTGTLAAASSNGRQHTLPKNPAHAHVKKLAATTHWTAEQTKAPTRLWGTTTRNRFGGEELPESSPERWSKGEYWNVDSNISIWGEHEVRRNAASGSHDIHRHDQIWRLTLPPVPGQDRPPHQCVSGVVSADCSFLEAWGFPLGKRDRQANFVGPWKPTGQGEAFRSHRSFNRNLDRMTESFRTMRRNRSEPGRIAPEGAVTLKAEDVGGEAGDLCTPDDSDLARMGRTFGARSCNFWNRHDHTARREAAKLSCSIHSPSLRSSRDDHPFKENSELCPASIYTLKYRKLGPDSLRNRETPTERTQAATSPAGDPRSYRTNRAKP